MILTSQNIHAFGTAGCGFNAKQLQILGVTEKKKGWLTRLIGKEISEEDYRRLMDLRNSHHRKEPIPNPDHVLRREVRAIFKGLLTALKANNKAKAAFEAQLIFNKIQNSR